MRQINLSGDLMVLIKELKANSAIPEIELLITSKGEPRGYANEKGSGKVCNASGRDSSGDEVSITLWNEHTTAVNENDNIKIKDGWCSEYKGKLQVSPGKRGTLEVIAKE
jgi:ssDNA-binding replication factor A large subunit